MNIKKMDIATLRDLRNLSIERIRQVDTEIDRRMDLSEGRIKVEDITVSRLASEEGVTPTTIVDRCKRKDIPVIDKDGNPSSRGKQAYVNVNLYNLHYK